MAKHIIERGLSKLEDQAADIRQKTEDAFAEMERAIESGSRTAQTKALDALHNLVEVTQNLGGAIHGHATALMTSHAPAPSPVEQATDDGETKTKARVTRTSVPQVE